MRQVTTSSEKIGASVIGSGILGFGLGILLYSFFENLAWPIIIVGIIIHSIGMYLVHKGRQDNSKIGDIFYWICWLILIIIFIIFIWRYF